MYMSIRKMYACEVDKMQLFWYVLHYMYYALLVIEVFLLITIL